MRVNAGRMAPSRKASSSGLAAGAAHGGGQAPRSNRGRTADSACIPGVLRCLGGRRQTCLRCRPFSHRSRRPLTVWAQCARPGFMGRPAHQGACPATPGGRGRRRRSGRVRQLRPVLLDLGDTVGSTADNPRAVVCGSSGCPAWPSQGTERHRRCLQTISTPAQARPLWSSC